MPGSKDSVPIRERYNWLSEARKDRHKSHWQDVAESLKIAEARDAASHKYFDALLINNRIHARALFLDLYTAINKPPIPDTITVDVALLLDATGSMGPYSKPTVSTINCLMNGNNTVIDKLKLQFPDTEVKLRFGVLAYRDIDDGSAQFFESVWDTGSHLTTSSNIDLAFVENAMAQPSGGADPAEDHLGALHRALSWNGPDDWSSQIKLVVVFTDAPAHGYVPTADANTPGIDGYALAHPEGLTPASLAGDLIEKEAGLVFCSFNPYATSPFEEKLAMEYLNHKHNSEGREVKSISMIPRSSTTEQRQVVVDHPRHIVFILDESGSMECSWPGVVAAFHDFVDCRLQNQNELDLVSVVQFGSRARVTMVRKIISAARRNLDQSGGGTCFAPAALEGSQLVESTPASHKPTVVFMSDGGTNDAAPAASTFAALNQKVQQKYGDDLDLYVIAFGHGADTAQLQQISRSSPKGRVRLCSDTVQLTNIFVNIAAGQEVATALKEEIGKEISDAVSDTLCLGYLS